MSRRPVGGGCRCPCFTSPVLVPAQAFWAALAHPCWEAGFSPGAQDLPPVWAYLSFLPEQAPLPTQVPRKAGPGESPASPHASSLMLAL